MNGLAEVRSQMAERGWAIACIPFTYNQHDYYVLVRRYLPPADKKPPLALVELCFLDREYTSRALTTAANSVRYFVDVKELREYFRVAFEAIAQGFLQNLYEQFGNQLPHTLPEHVDAEARPLILRHLSQSDSEDPNKLYCAHIRRNPPPQERSIYNSQKTQLLRPELFERLRNDTGLSFCYSTNAEDERNDTEILDRLALSQGE